MKQVLERVAVTLASVAFVFLCALIVLEWAVGCGETWVQADGSRIVGECVFIGRW